jgi:putative transposase
LDEFVVMPNHLHGIIHIVFDGRDAINRVSTNLKSRKTSLSEIIRWHKGRSTYEIRKNGAPHFSWQSRFHDHIIRSDESLNKIRSYIRKNPSNWANDDMYELHSPSGKGSKGAT